MKTEQRECPCCTRLIEIDSVIRSGSLSRCNCGMQLSLEWERVETCDGPEDCYWFEPVAATEHIKLAALRGAAVALGKPVVGQAATLTTEYGSLDIVGALVAIEDEPPYLTWECKGVGFGRWEV